MPKKNETEILKLAAARFEEAFRADQSEREEADSDIRFAINEGGCQWDETVRNIRENDDPPRPCLVINLIPEKIDQIEGEFRQADVSYKVRPVDSKADPRKAEIIAGMLRFIEYDSRAKNAYNTSTNSVFYGGRGGWRWNVVEDEDNPWVRSLKIGRLTNIFTLYCDPFSKDLDKSDARYWFCTNILPEEEYKQKYKDSYAEFPGGNEWQEWKVEDSRRVAEYWWKEDEEITYYQVMRGDREQVVTKVEEFEDIIDEKKVKRPKIKWCVLAAGKILEGPHEDWPSKYFPFVWQTGKETMVNGKSRSRGMVRFAKEPCQLYNYAATQMSELLQNSPKAPYLLTATMLDKYKEIWDQAPKKNFFFLPFKADPMMPGGPKREMGPTIDASMFNMLAVLEHNVDGAMGVHPAKLGEKSNEKSGKAIFARQAQGSTGAFVYTDNFSAALTHSCRIGIDLIPHVYDTERIVRILGDDGKEMEIPINTNQMSPMMAQMGQQVPPQMLVANQENFAVNDLKEGRYDVRVTVGPSYATQRQESLEMLVEMVRNIPNIAPALLVGIIENMDIPKQQQLLERVKSLVPENLGGTQQPQPQPPDPEVLIKMQELQLSVRDQIRKEFDSYFKAMGVVAQAESLEAGTQADQYLGIVDRHHKEIELKQQAAQQAQAQQGQGAPQ